VAREGVVTLIAGARGTGKTFAANHNLRRERRILAYDRTATLFETGPLRFDNFEGELFEDLKAMRSMLVNARTSSVGFRLGLVDKTGTQRDAFLALVKQLTDAPRGEKPGNRLVVWFVEAHKTFPRTQQKLPEDLDELIRTARHRRLDIQFDTQKANDLPSELREEGDRALIFRHTKKLSLDAAVQIVGDPALRQQIRTLPNKQFFEIDDVDGLTGPKRVTTRLGPRNPRSALKE